VAVDRLRIVAPGIQPIEIGVGRRDGPHVLRPVEPTPRIFSVRVEADRDGATPEAPGEL
jgi:hypothetical protein